MLWSECCTFVFILTELNALDENLWDAEFNGLVDLIDKQGYLPITTTVQLKGLGSQFDAIFLNYQITGTHKFVQKNQGNPVTNGFSKVTGDWDWGGRVFCILDKKIMNFGVMHLQSGRTFISQCIWLFQHLQPCKQKWMNIYILEVAYKRFMKFPENIAFWDGADEGIFKCSTSLFVSCVTVTRYFLHSYKADLLNC